MVIISILVVSVIYFFLPAPIVKGYENLEIYRVELITGASDCQDNIDIVDITKQVDCEKILRILSGYSRSKIPHMLEPHELGEGDIEISIMDKDNSNIFRIYLSENNRNFNYIYESAEKGGYTIHNSNNLRKEISPLF
jgi:hypothetical protein